MAGFSLGGSHNSRREGVEDHSHPIPPESLLLYGGGGKSEDSIPYTSRGFKLWQHQQQQQQQQQQQIQRLYSSPSSFILGFPTSEQIGLGNSTNSSGIAGAGAGMRGGGGISCQDCGNQAKKDCSHLRCRTCCKSRGFHCATHVKSTWVPAAKRRERQLQLTSLHQHQSQPLQIGATAAGAGSEPFKRPREISSLPHTAITPTSSGGMEGASFPPEVSSPAVFRCVRVSPVDEAEDEIAYQTAVTIGGHVFKGILYDQGPDSSQQIQGESSPPAPAEAAAAATTAAAAATIATTFTTTAAAAASSAGLLDPSSLYPTPLGAFMAGTPFFPHHPSTR